MIAIFLFGYSLCQDFLKVLKRLFTQFRV